MKKIIIFNLFMFFVKNVFLLLMFVCDCNEHGFFQLQKRTLFECQCSESSAKVLIGTLFCTSPAGDGTTISTWSSVPREGPAVCSAHLHFSVI